LWERVISNISQPNPACSGNIAEKAIPETLHVLTLTPFYPSRGDEVSGCFVAETLQQLEKLGVRSSVIAVDPIYHPRRKSNLKFPAEWIRYPKLPGNFGLSSAGRFLGESLLRRARLLHRHNPVNVIHAHAALPCGHAAAVLSRRLGIPFVVTIHGLDVFNSCFESGIAAQWRRKASMDVYQKATMVICISDKVRKLTADEPRGAVKTEVVYNGTDPDLFSPGPTSDDAQTVLIVGNLLAGKGHELVLTAISKLRHSSLHSSPNLRCIIIGEGADRDRFAALARNLGISEQVHFLGRCSRAEVAEAMRHCTLFVLPSRYEGLGCVYLEAMASGKPVIACRGQGIDEIIDHGKNGWLIPVDGLDELVQALQLLLGNSELRDQIGRAARQTILDGITMSHQAQKLLKIYQEAAR
jgi:teichuronic acid biosynthesis glycosyltransferase TuaC